MFFKRKNIYAQAYDAYLLNLISTKKAIKVGKFTIEFEGGEQIWIDDGTPWKPVELKIKPSKQVMRKFQKFVGESFLKGLADEFLLREVANNNK